MVALAARNPRASEDAGAVIASLPGIASGPVRAEGVTAAVLEQSLRHGDDFAYVCVRRRPVDGCRDARELIDSVRWLVGLHDDLDRVWLPLVDTRAYAIVTRGRVAMFSDGEGCRIAPGFAAP
jgi:hypothetical protein